MNTTQQKRVPTLRFKDERGRDYPDWENKRLGELYEITSSKRVFQSEWKDSGVPFYRAREIIELSKNGYVDNDIFISPEMYKKYSEKYGAPKENDLLVTGVGTIGRLYVVPKNSKFYIKDGNIVWLKDKNLISGVFIKYLFHTRYIEKQLFDNASITTVATYTIESAKKTKVLIPATDEQQKIAAFFSSVDIKIEQLGKKRALLEQYKKGIMQELFSQEIRFKDEQGNSYPLWAKKKLASIGKFVGGGTPDTSIKKYWKGDIPWITSADIVNGDISNINIHRYITEEAVQNSATNKVPKNSVIFATRVGIGKIAVAKSEICISQDFTSLILKNDLSSFIGYLFQSNKNLILRYNQGTSIKGITSKDLKNITVRLPILQEQQKIANFLSAIDKKIELVAGQLEQARTFKKGLLQQMFI